MKKKVILIIVLVILLIGGGIYYLKKLTINTNKEVTKHDSCLDDNEFAEYKVEKIDELYGKTYVIIQNKNTNNKISFDIQNTQLNYHPVEVRKCGIYLIREFNIDLKKMVFQHGFNNSLWKYDYNGNGTNLITLAEKTEDKVNIYYSPDFRVDPTETHLVLIRSYLGSPNYAIIIKDLKTLKDVFTLPMTEIERQKPELAQDIEFNGWTKDGRYFWANTHYGANTLGFIRIDTTDWSFKIIPAPKDVLGGDALNLENGYITVHPGNVWYGVAEITEQEKAKRRAQGIGTELYIYNLFTNQKQFVVSTAEPLYYFKPQWLSDTQLQYEMPDGEKKIYEIK